MFLGSFCLQICCQELSKIQLLHYIQTITNVLLGLVPVQPTVILLPTVNVLWSLYLLPPSATKLPRYKASYEY